MFSLFTVIVSIPLHKVQLRVIGVDNWSFKTIILALSIAIANVVILFSFESDRLSPFYDSGENN
ncbi:hypothetical protein [Nostoc sp.]|uniref:hypothetical protein n=1 Tax=Nostoc sp. TaxID=1180 RepID=UPI002FFC8AD7